MLSLLTAVVVWVRAGIDELIAELHVEAEHDPLTGLLNREGLRRRSERLFGAAGGQGADVALLLVDADHFKQLNDRYGHPAGDAALSWLSRLLTSTVPDTGLVCRYGGEEFVVLVPACDLDTSVLEAERIRRRVEQDGRATAYPFTVSIGVAVGPFEPGLAELYRQADAALYRAKRGGRNRVAAASVLQAAAERAS
nr:GGDEF domain-containing protein [Motilibacter aurantiacus]